MQKIISWNVASVRARLENVLKLLKDENPDVVFLQEIKATEETFPSFEFLAAGYTAVICGQKSYNGVAILSKHPLKNVVDKLPGLDEGDDQARFIQAEDQNGTVYISVYVPNGNPPEKDPTDTSKLTYKLQWMKALYLHIKQLLDNKKSVVLGGDFNVIERDTDVYNPEAYRDNALMVPEVRQSFHELTLLPMVNAIREFNPDAHTYSFWDFQMQAWPKNFGMLLDALFVSNDIKGRLSSAGIYRDVRGWDKTSDHAPIFCVLD